MCFKKICLNQALNFSWSNQPLLFAPNAAPGGPPSPHGSYIAPVGELCTANGGNILPSALMQNIKEKDCLEVLRTCSLYLLLFAKNASSAPEKQMLPVA